MVVAIETNLVSPGFMPLAAAGSVCKNPVQLPTI
jgi:hypothetical protein